MTEQTHHQSDANTYQQGVTLACLSQLREVLTVVGARGNLVRFSGRLTPTAAHLRLVFDHPEAVEVLADITGLRYVASDSRARAAGDWMGGTLTLMAGPSARLEGGPLDGEPLAAVLELAASSDEAVQA